MSGRTSGPTSLAEGRWLWRRLYVFSASAALWLLLDRTLARVPAASLPRLVEALMALLALTLVLYLVAPTAQQLVTLAANLRLRLGAGGRS
tara:strand:- start:1233 stop:1505 length:273 start_codon:yes stop_codon:yes gene_type:complete